MKIKYLNLFILFFIFCSCQEQVKKKVTDIENKNYFKPNKKIGIEKKDTTTIDFLNKNYFYDEKTKLRNGYNIEFKYFQKNKNDIIEMCLNLRKGNKIIDTLNVLGYGSIHKNLGYIGADFKDYFAFLQSYGSGNPHEMQLLRKNDGKEIIKGFIIDADEKNEILLYCKGYDSLMLYDIKKNKNNFIENLKNSKEIDCMVSELTEYLKIKKVSSKLVLINIENSKNKIITKKYYR